MNDLVIIFKVFGKVFMNFLPAFLSIIIGLAILAVNEKSDKHKEKPSRGN